MSKSKTKCARRQAKREESRKVFAHHRKTAVASLPNPSARRPSKKQKHKPNPQTTNTPSKPKPHIQASQKHEVPFGVYDKILLVGEGNFSFTRSLVIEQGCANVTATSYDGEEDVRSKYPSFEGIHEELTALTPPVPFFHGIDATKLATYKKLREEGSWDTIAFMFPHTGGLSTDVNRQVRANQSLLVSFFRSCLDLSAHPSSSKPPRKCTHPFLKTGGKAIVALFEGEPYTLWNVRDLARHAGLKVVESFRFDWEQYPGYAHVRTLGTIEGGGAWKGEDRLARMYVFEKVESGDEGENAAGKKETGGKGKKRSREESESESDES